LEQAGLARPNTRLSSGVGSTDYFWATSPRVQQVWAHAQAKEIVKILGYNQNPKH